MPFVFRIKISYHLVAQGAWSPVACVGGLHAQSFKYILYINIDSIYVTFLHLFLINSP